LTGFNTQAIILRLLRKFPALTKNNGEYRCGESDDIEKCIRIADTVILSSEASSFEIMKYASRNYPGKTSITIDIRMDRY